MKKKWCEKCKERKFCSVPCDKLNAYLKSCGIYSDDWIRPQVSKEKRKDGFGKWREVPFSGLSKYSIDKNPLLNGGNDEQD
jgi:hypothetical protein